MIILYTIFTFCTIIFLKFINLYLFSQYHLLFHQFCVILLLTLLLIVKVFPAQEGINVYNSVSLTRLSALLRRFFFVLLLSKKGGFFNMQDTRIALLGIILTSHDSVENLNHLLSQYSSYIIGRMGVPYREKNISIISVALDAPNDIISSLSGKIGMLPGVSSKTIYTKS